MSEHTKYIRQARAMSKKAEKAHLCDLLPDLTLIPSKQVQYSLLLCYKLKQQHAGLVLCGTFALFVPAGVLQQRINCGLRSAKPSKGTWLRSSSLTSLTLSLSEQAPLLQASPQLVLLQM